MRLLILRESIRWNGYFGAGYRNKFSAQTDLGIRNSAALQLMGNGRDEFRFIRLVRTALDDSMIEFSGLYFRSTSLTLSHFTGKCKCRFELDAVHVFDLFMMTNFSAS